MTKSEKIAALSKAMKKRTRNSDPDDTFYCFTDTAPRSLIDLFLEHYEVRDIDYETFSLACDIVAEVYSEREGEMNGDEQNATVEDEIYERASDSASVYTSDRLAYLNNQNEYDISNVMREYDCTSIADACAIWYDRQVEQAAILISEWINSMHTKTITTTSQVLDDSAHALAWLSSEYPRGVDLVSIDYRDSYDDNLQSLEKVLRDGYSDNDTDWIGNAQYETINYILGEYIKENEGDEVSDEVFDAMRDWLYEHDTSNSTRDLLRNTSRQLFFIETPDYYEKDDIIEDGYYTGSNTNEKVLTKKYAKTPEQVKEIATACRESFYSAPVSFYFYADPEEVYDALHKSTDPYITVNGAYFSTVDRVQGSNWLGESAVFTLSIPREDFAKSVFLDRAKGHGYSWYGIAGQSDYDDATVYAEAKRPKGGVRLGAYVSPEAEREAQLEKNWKETGKCTLGDMNMKRHAHTEYRNNVPCGTHCLDCGTFWID